MQASFEAFCAGRAAASDEVTGGASAARVSTSAHGFKLTAEYLMRTHEMTVHVQDGCQVVTGLEYVSLVEATPAE